MDKYRSKIIFEGVGIPTPKLRFFGTAAEAREFIAAAATAYGQPLVVKPNAQGSTIGLSIVRDHTELPAAVQLAAEYDSHILIEDYIAGRELTVAVLGDEALPVVEIIPRSGFYDYRAKYTAGESTYVCPAELEPDVTDRIKDYALLAFKTLGCFGYARVDFRLEEEHRLFCLELNTLPGMTATSLVPKAARAAGMTFEQLLQRIVRLALDKETTKA
jgi:D-alanine-D-alanine ligase